MGIATLMKTFIHPLISSLGAACLLITALQAAPMDSAFNYNGRLLEGTTPANGDHDFEFYLFDVNRFGSPVAPAVSTPNVLVSNGLFSTVLNFGPAAFDGSGRWLEISVRRSGTGADFIILTP